MKIDLKNFIEGNENLFMLTNYKEAEVILNDFINYYESEKLKLCEVSRSLPTNEYCTLRVKEINLNMEEIKMPRKERIMWTTGYKLGFKEAQTLEVKRQLTAT